MLSLSVPKLFSIPTHFFYQRSKFSISLLFLLMSFLIYGHYVFSGEFTQSGDFGPAVSYALNFKEAVRNGQWLPRWVIVPRELVWGHGTMDGTLPTPDCPVFQYYAFLQSALAYPFMVLGLSAITALQLVVILAFAFAGFVLYTAGRNLGASRTVSLLSGYSYLMSPWLLSNFYGRGGISEALGQSTLPLILLAYSFAFKQKYRKAVLSMAFATILLALSHNIFLLYGMVMGGILIGSHLIFTYFSTIPLKPALSSATQTHIEIQIILIFGIVLGLAASSWQWIPVAMTMRELSFNYIGNFKGGLGTLADLSGAWGFPKQFVENGLKREYFFTIGWWTIPAIISLVFAKRELRLVALAVFFCFLVFFIFTYFPNHIIPYLPILAIAQFTFRFLAFLGVLGSFALCIAFPNLPRYVALGIFLLITMSQYHVLFFKLPSLKFPEEQYLHGFEYNAYFANSKYEKHLRYWYDGWMEAQHSLDLAELGGRPLYLTMSGKTKNNQKIKVFISKTSETEKPLTNIITLQGSFDTTFKIDKPIDGLHFSILNAAPNDGYLPIRPERIVLIPDPISAYVPATEVRKTFSYGYKRIFEINKTKLTTHQSDNGWYTVELPIIYNRFAVPSQKGEKLKYQVDFNHRLEVKTRDLNTPITVQYTLPLIVWLLSAGGIFILLGFLHNHKKN